MKYEENKISGKTKSSTNLFYQRDTGYIWYFNSFRLTFSCAFHFAHFPFDSHECSMRYGDAFGQIPNVIFEPPKLMYGDWKSVIDEEPIILNGLTQFEVKLKPLSSFEVEISGNNYSYTGVIFSLKRKNMGRLDSGYYYPTSAFAILSMISYLINPDVVRNTAMLKTLHTVTT